jgi:PAS fold
VSHPPQLWWAAWSGIYDTELRVVRTNVTPEMFGGSPLSVGSRLADVMSPQDAVAGETALRQVLETGVPLIGHEHPTRSPKDDGPQRSLLMSAVRLDDAQGCPRG